MNKFDFYNSILSACMYTEDLGKFDKTFNINEIKNRL